MSVLEGAEHGVEIHDARILADADLRIVLLDELPQAGEALEPVYDDMLSGQVIQRERGTGGQGMIGRHHGVPAFPDERHKGASGGMRPGAVIILNDIKGATVQVVEELVLGFHNRLLDDIRVFLEEGPAEAGEQVRLQADDGPDADAVAEGIGLPAAVEQQVHIRTELEYSVQEGLTRGCQADAGNAAFEEFEADFRFQPADLLLQGRGREEQGLCCGVEAVVFRDRDKGIQVPGIHGALLKKEFRVKGFPFHLYTGFLL